MVRIHAGEPLVFCPNLNRLPCEKRLADGSHLSTIYPSDKDRRHSGNGIRVRVVEYTLEGVAGAEPINRLVTSILDPGQAPAQELAALDHERWEIETALDELKTHLRGSKNVLRSKTPDLVRLEIYGLTMTHLAIRRLMHEAALQEGEDPDRLSFLHAVRVVRRKVPQFVAIPPLERKASHKAVLAEILEERAVSSRGRQILRGVKRKMSNFPLRPRNATATGPVNYAKHVKVVK